MHIWWLSFLDGGVVIVEAGSLAQARLLAVTNELGRASQFAKGYAIDRGILEQMPEDWVGRMLSPVEATRLAKLLKDGPRRDFKLSDRTAPDCARTGHRPDRNLRKAAS
jgi:hypothetical protein